MKDNKLTQKKQKEHFDSVGTAKSGIPYTPGLHKLGGPAQAAAASRAKNFYPFD